MTQDEPLLFKDGFCLPEDAGRETASKTGSRSCSIVAFIKSLSKKA